MTRLPGGSSHTTPGARRRQRTGSKIDLDDALAIARVGSCKPSLPPPRPDGGIEQFCCLLPFQRELVADRARPINCLHAGFDLLRPCDHQRLDRLGNLQTWMRSAGCPRGNCNTRAPIARNRIKALRAEAHTVDSLALRTCRSVDETCITLCSFEGVGNPTRFRSEATLVMVTGAAPIEGIPGGVQHHRHIRASSRELHKAVRTEALKQVSHRHTKDRHY